MYVDVAILKETMRHERRVAIVPAIAIRPVQLGCLLPMRSGAGEAIHLPDAAFKHVVMVADDTMLVEDADLVLAVQPPAIEIAGGLSVGSVLVSFIYPDRNPERLAMLLERRIACFAMERVPRITRAQGMDAPSSQAALAGYHAAGLGLTHLSRILSKMTTAAGTIGPAKVLVIGLGVAGLEAIATAQRLCAVVEGYDVRPDTAEQALSLGATFVDVLLAEAGVPYDLIFALDAIDADFAETDVVLAIGANDVVNPAARIDKSSRISGMPILDADKATKVYVVKRGKGKGYAGIVKTLFYQDNSDMVYGDAQAVLVKRIEAVRGVSLATAA